MRPFRRWLGLILQRMRSRVDLTSNTKMFSSSADAKGSSVVPFGGSLNLVPGQMLPHNFQPYVLPIPQRFAPQQRPPHQYQSHSQQSDHSQQSGHSQMSTHRYLAPAVNEFNPYDAHNPSAPRAPRVSPQPHASPAPVQAPIPAVHTKYPSQPLQQELHHSHSYEPSDPSYSDAMDESDAYGGIMEDFDLPPVPMPVPAPYRNVRNSAPVPRPPAQSTPDLNLQRANTAYTSRDTHMGRHPNNSQPSFIRQERSNGMVRQPTNGTPYNAPARLPNSNDYDYGSGQYSDPRHPYQAPPQQHLPPPQQYQGGPPPPDRHYTSSVQQSVTSSSSQWTGPQPLHIPRTWSCRPRFRIHLIISLRSIMLIRVTKCIHRMLRLVRVKLGDHSLLLSSIDNQRAGIRLPMHTMHRSSRNVRA
ncbi:hypothetical protein CPB85DRAFT_24152 [Mucidula mucida]|nr:hypothetical protein CPB85DRAFT_24152 [Mucidula mucida]